MAVIDGRPIAMQVERNRGGWVLTTRGASHRIRVLHTRTAELARFMIEKVPPDLSRFLICPMPGLPTAICEVVGDKVEAAQQLATAEEMTLESLLRAENTAPGQVRKPGAGKRMETAHT